MSVYVFQGHLQWYKYLSSGTVPWTREEAKVALAALLKNGKAKAYGTHYITFDPDAMEEELHRNRSNALLDRFGVDKLRVMLYLAA